jgi:probable phosphoglycerate mutase
MTEFLLVRHALPTSGSADPGLAPEGQEQARRLGIWLRNEKIDAIVCSPMQRAVETARLIADGAGRTAPVVLDELHELEAEGTSGAHYMPAEQLGVHPVALALSEGRYEDVQPRHEWDNFRLKALACRTELLARFPQGRVVAVAHGGIINAVLAGVLELPGVFWFYPGYTSVSRMESLPSGRIVLRSLNDMAHLSTNTMQDNGL